MSVFSFVIKANQDIRFFMAEVHARLQDRHIVKNPFEGGVYFYPTKKGKEHLYVVTMQPLYPPLYWFGFIGFVIALFWRGLSWWLLPGGLLFASAFFYTAPFFWVMLSIGVWKAHGFTYLKPCSKSYALMHITSNRGEKV